MVKFSCIQRDTSRTRNIVLTSTAIFRLQVFTKYQINRKQSRNVSESDGQEMDSMIPEPIYSAGGANEKPFIREFAPLMTSATETPKETLTSINTPSAPKKGKLNPIEELK
ncbi:hypothetical protein OUZ56_019094 [Daphnia magna]|uniref:Uncharacterized protein n=1 Tax=Daphnia magna TaxID=35525 RepID=A0ABQ9ZAM6_9CRUS|nr:hypothetical protein OUZ56_019094 [Daphnia magna]